MYPHARVTVNKLKRLGSPLHYTLQAFMFGSEMKILQGTLTVTAVVGVLGPSRGPDTKASVNETRY